MAFFFYYWTAFFVRGHRWMTPREWDRGENAEEHCDWTVILLFCRPTRRRRTCMRESCGKNNEKRESFSLRERDSAAKNKREKRTGEKHAVQFVFDECTRHASRFPPERFASQQTERKWVSRIVLLCVRMVRKHDAQYIHEKRMEVNSVHGTYSVRHRNAPLQTWFFRDYCCFYRPTAKKRNACVPPMYTVRTSANV